MLWHASKGALRVKFRVMNAYIAIKERSQGTRKIRKKLNPKLAGGRK